MAANGVATRTGRASPLRQQEMKGGSMGTNLELLELEVTGQCQLECRHCYANSGPRGTHGEMAVGDWLRVIDQAACMGVKRIQMIGGEPTLYPGTPTLVRNALAQGMEVEVYSNLVNVTPDMWELFWSPGVRLATSYYSDDPDAHNAVSRRRSHHKTRANIERAVALGIPIRVGLIEIDEAQEIEKALATLKRLGVQRIDPDRMRGIGRGVRDGEEGVDQLCGQCGDGRLAVLPSGKVTPCVMSRWMDLGNVRNSSLSKIDSEAGQVRSHLREAFSRRASKGSSCPPGTTPCTPYVVCAPAMVPPDGRCKVV
jgi:MoaA/NifB/PqqE/SkfB family radical SAM enzyme